VRYPKVVVEVLSDSTREYDRGDKFLLYRASPTLEEYVLVEAARREVEVYRRETDGTWVSHRYRGDEDIELASVDARCPVAAFYDDIDV
jgi:Uma2 family endonuclease